MAGRMSVPVGTIIFTGAFATRSSTCARCTARASAAADSSPSASDERSDVVRVTIANEARPLPLLDAGGALLGIVNGNGNLEVRVTAEQPTQPSWARSSDAGGDPAGWIGAWAS